MAATMTQDRTAARGPGGPRVRKTWRVVGSITLGAMLVFGVYQVVVTLAHDEYTVTQEFDASGITAVEVDNNADGAVRIVGSDTDTITVTAHVSDGLRRTGHSQRIEDGRLVLHSTCPLFGSDFCSVEYTVQTPPGVDVVARADNSGITVSDITGDVDVRSSNGRVELARIGGAVRAESDNGSVDLGELTADDVQASSDNGSVRLDFDRAPRTVVVDSDNGEVEVVLPRGDEVYQLSTEADNGTVFFGVSTDPTSSRSIQATTDNGDVIIRYRSS